MIGHFLIGLHGGNVWVDQHRLNALCTKCFETLWATVIKLPSLCNDNTASPQYQHLAWFEFSQLIHLGLLHSFNKLLEQVLRVLWTTVTLWVKLNTVKRFGLVTNTFVAVVVRVYKVLLPLIRVHWLKVDGKAVILGGNHHSTITRTLTRLILSTVAILHLIRSPTRGKS